MTIGKIIKCELDAEARDTLSSMAYRAWATAFDNLKAVKNETATAENIKIAGSKRDWELSHKAQLENAEKEFAKAQRVRDAICKYTPIILGE